MKQTLLFTAAALMTTCVFASAGPAAAATESAQSKACYDQATHQNLHGASRKAFHRSCMKGVMSPNRPTARTAPNSEAQAITKPSGVDRTVRSKQCSDEAAKKGLVGKDRQQFRLSCIATAGPVTEGETKNQTPKPAKAIPGIGINNYNPPH
jgi:hypothetical protein